MGKKGIILGAGIIGSAIAYALSQRGVTDLDVLDVDLEGSLSSTERNAGGVRHFWSQPINIELSRISIEFFASLGAEIGFSPSGYFWLFSKPDADRGMLAYEHAKNHGLQYSLLEPNEIQKKYPFMDKLEDVAFGVFGARDGLLNSNALKVYFRKEAEKKGVRFHNHTWINHFREESSKAIVETTKVSQEKALDLLENPSLKPNTEKKIFQADFAVLCTGAWSGELLKDHLKDPIVKPIRRQISVFKSDEVDLSNFGMFVDTSGVYFHKEGGNIIGGLVLKEELPGFKFDADSDFFESHIWPALYERSSGFERLKHVTSWGGLYSYTPDVTGILGAIPNTQCLFEAHSFTGHGVMQSYGVGLAFAKLILEGKDSSGLSRKRFEDKKLWLSENLHI